MLALFAVQAASAIANARTHRAEQRARADLEALIETSPVGVVLFDAKNGLPVSFNREARRIVETLRTPGNPPEQLIEVLSCRRVDGREVSLSEFPMAQQFSAGETVGAEEIVLSVPDGRSVRTLVNSNPIHAADGPVESVVVTMQDLAPLDEIERMRTEFLGLVSHELRTPLAAIMGSTGTLLDASQTLDPAEQREFLRVIDEQARHMRALIGDLLNAGHIETGTLSVAPEPSEMAELVEQTKSTFLGGGGGGLRPGARDLQGPDGGARRAHPGGQRRRRPRHHGHLHDPGRRRVRRSGARPAPRGQGDGRAAAHPGGRRRPADAPLRVRGPGASWPRGPSGTARSSCP